MTVNLFPSATQSTATDERYTPQWVFDGLALHFDTDPASPVDGGDCVFGCHQVHDQRRRAARPLGWARLAQPAIQQHNAVGRSVRRSRQRRVPRPRRQLGMVGRLTKASTYLWLCRDFAFTHPTHAGRRSSMPLFFAAIGEQATDGLLRLARSERHDGTLVRVAS